MGGNDPEEYFDSVFLHLHSSVESVNASNNLITIAKRCQDKWNFDRNFFSSEFHPTKDSDRKTFIREKILDRPARFTLMHAEYKHGNHRK